MRRLQLVVVMAASLFASVALAQEPQVRVEPERPAAAKLVDTARTPDELAQLYATAGGYGALTGAWVRELAGGESKLSLVVPVAGAAVLGVAGTALLDRSDALTLGLPQAIVTDTFIGAEIAGAWVWHYRSVNQPSERWPASSELTLLWGGATLGASIGVVRYALSPSTPGRAAFTGTTTLWGGALSGLLAGALTPSAAKRDDNASQAAALGLELGVVAGSFAGRLLDPSLGWVRALDAGALLGGTLAGAGYVLVTGSPLDDQGTLAFGAAGVTVGLASAALLAPKLGLPRKTSFSVGPDFALGGVGIGARGVF